MFSISVYAETNAVSYKATVDNENVSVTTDILTSDTDYSDLYVNVIREINGQQTTIYSGALGGYANGTFSDVDFSEINFMVVFDWNTMEDEAIYIIPASTVNTFSETQSNTFTSLQPNKSEFFKLEDALDIEDTTGAIPKKIYDVDLLPSDYLEYMSELGGETGNYGDDSIPAPAVSYDIVIEKYSVDGTLLLKSKRENVSLTSNAPSLYLSSDFNCQDGSYVVISAYERRKFTKLIAKSTVKPAIFDFTIFN